MARIRSVHPGLFTDEAFVSLSPMARLMLIGLWTECDDKGAFEWKPVSLKMRLLPADNADATALLAELETADTVKKYTVDGREYGAVRNFGKYQRPKKPNSLYPMPDEFRTYARSGGSSSELDDGEPGTVPKKSEISPQMEDGGGRGRVESTSTAAQQPEPRARGADHYSKLDAALREAGQVEKDPSPGLFDLSPINGLLDAGYDLNADILPVIRKKAATGFRPRSWGYFVPMIHEARGVRQQAGSVPAAKAATSSDLQHPDEPMMRRWWDAWKKLEFWHLDWGPPPNDPDCRIPQNLREQWSHEAAA